MRIARATLAALRSALAPSCAGSWARACFACPRQCRRCVVRRPIEQMESEQRINHAEQRTDRVGAPASTVRPSHCDLFVVVARREIPE